MTEAINAETDANKIKLEKAKLAEVENQIRARWKRAGFDYDKKTVANRGKRLHKARTFADPNSTMLAKYNLRIFYSDVMGTWNTMLCELKSEEQRWKAKQLLADWKKTDKDVGLRSMIQRYASSECWKKIKNSASLQRRPPFTGIALSSMDDKLDKAFGIQQIQSSSSSSSSSSFSNVNLALHDDSGVQLGRRIVDVEAQEGGVVVDGKRTCKGETCPTGVFTAQNCIFARKRRIVTYKRQKIVLVLQSKTVSTLNLVGAKLRREIAKMDRIYKEWDDSTDAELVQDCNIEFLPQETIKKLYQLGAFSTGTRQKIEALLQKIMRQFPKP